MVVRFVFYTLFFFFFSLFDAKSDVSPFVYVCMWSDLGMEHFMKKVEAAYCSACDLYIPMQFLLIQKHLKSPEHNYNRKVRAHTPVRKHLVYPPVITMTFDPCRFWL